VSSDDQLRAADEIIAAVLIASQMVLAFAFGRYRRVVREEVVVSIMTAAVEFLSLLQGR